METPAIVFAVVLGLLSLAALIGSLHFMRERRLLADIPTCKAAGVYIGLVEVKGTAETDAPLESPLAKSRCVWHRHEVKEHWRKTTVERDKDGKPRTKTETGWTTVGGATSADAFYVRDDTGAVLLRPEGADVEAVPTLDRTCRPEDPMYYGLGPASAVEHSTHERRFTERVVPLHAPLYVVGQAREREDVVAPEIAADKRAPLFLVSTRTEEQVGRSLTGLTWAAGLLGLGLAAGLWYLLRSNGVRAAPAAFAYVPAWFLLAGLRAYNGLVELRQRVRQAFSLVDVELRRRHDLIPRLSAVVGGLADHERTLQTEIAALRTQAAATAPGLPGPDPDGLRRHMAVVVERYPDLVADASFGRLMAELSRTEERIALAREFLNEIANAYNTRIGTIPDRLLAAVGRLAPHPLFTAGEFERAPVKVEFAR